MGGMEIIEIDGDEKQRIQHICVISKFSHPKRIEITDTIWKVIYSIPGFLGSYELKYTNWKKILLLPPKFFPLYAV